MPRLALFTVSFLVLAGCNEPNSQFCANGAHPDDPLCKKGGPCTTNTDCTSTPNFPVCDTTDNDGTCVLCTANDHALCTGMTPRCDNHACVACVDDNDCGDPGVGVCLPNGSCADPSSIIHAVSMNGSTANTCGGIGIGNACTLDTALTLPKSSTKNIIKLDDAGPYVSTMNNFVVNTDATIEFTIDARGATLHKNADGAILTISSNNASNKAVTILGGTIEGATGGGGGGDGIRCTANATLSVYGTTIRTNEESAIDAATCTLTVEGADIHDNSQKVGTAVYPGIQSSDGSVTISRSSIASNRGGGIVVNNNGTFTIVGNVFVSNGDNGANVSGVSINTTASGNRLEFNTITQNKSNMAAGVQCSASNFTAQNNIIWNNNSALSVNAIQVSSGCQYAYSDIGPFLTPIVNDHNMTIDPSFVNGMTNLHLEPGTGIRGKADPGADLTGIASKDMDGKLRVQPADLGAYIAPPQ
jgi:hypothetical protein